MTIYEVLAKNECAGVIIKLTDCDRYFVKSANDMGFFFETQDLHNEGLLPKEKVLRKITLGTVNNQVKYVYELENKGEIDSETCDDSELYEEAIIYLLHCNNLSKLPF